MRKKHVLAAAALAVAAPLAGMGTAGAALEEKAQAEILGPVQLNDDGTATVTARYICPSGIHLWVSAKQVEDRGPDARLQEEGSSSVSEAWLQSHPAPGTYTCNGKWQTGSFVIDTAEQGWGELERGQAWVQFCLIGDQMSFFLSKTRWAAVV